MSEGYWNEIGIWVPPEVDPDEDEVGKKLIELIKSYCDYQLGWTAGIKDTVTAIGPCQFNGTGRRGAAVVARLIGMEAFTLAGAYLANKKDLILTLAPKSAESFRFIEVPIAQALESFDGMRPLLDSIFKQDTIEAISGMRKVQLVEEERRRALEKANQYNDKFGAW